MKQMLRDYFSTIRDREEVLTDINSKESLLQTFEQWNSKQQDLFLDYCTGIRGVKILYDHFFKLIFNPESHPERLEEILSLLLQQPIKIVKVLPNESTRIAAEKSLLVLDIVVKLQNGSIANIEVQRIGYAFPGQRSACYSADLLMRQYKRVRKLKKKKFQYSQIKKVYTIVFFERSTSEFHKFPETYIHRSKQVTDTGLEIDLLQDYIFIPLDIFRQSLHNKGVDSHNKLEAWLTFLSEDNPKWILELIQKHPEFVELYKEVYEACQNTEVIMGIFSKELIEMDQNTVDFMIDEMQNTIDSLKTENTALASENTLLASENTALASKNTALASENTALASENTALASENTALASEKKLLLETIAQLKNQLEKSKE